MLKFLPTRYFLTSALLLAPGFDPNAFMQQTIDAPLEDELKLVDPGEYKAMIDDFDSSYVEQIEFEYKKGQRAGQQGSMTKFNCPFVIDSPEQQAKLNRDKIVVSKQIILDIDQTGNLDFGTNKNVPLGQIRTAVGQQQTKPWGLANLRGSGPVMVRVEHREGKRDDGTEWKRAEVTRVTRIA